MSKKQKRQAIVFPSEQKLLQQLGENIRLAMKRRKITQTMIAERTGLSKPTLRSIERGISTVSIGHYLRVLAVLGLAEDLAKVASDDSMGRKLQDIELLNDTKSASSATTSSNSNGQSDYDSKTTLQVSKSVDSQRIKSLMAKVKSRSSNTSSGGDNQ